MNRLGQTAVTAAAAMMCGLIGINLAPTVNGWSNQPWDYSARPPVSPVVGEDPHLERIQEQLQTLLLKQADRAPDRALEERLGRMEEALNKLPAISPALDDRLKLLEEGQKTIAQLLADRKPGDEPVNRRAEVAGREPQELDELPPVQQLQNQPPTRLNRAQQQWLRRLESYPHLKRFHSDAEIVRIYGFPAIWNLRGDVLPPELDPAQRPARCAGGVNCKH